MRLTFQLRYHTHFGQSLWLTGDDAIFGGGDLERAIPLEYLDDQNWRVTFVIPDSLLPHADLEYHYALRTEGGSFIHDWGNGRTINPASLQGRDVLIIDSWNDPSFYENAFYSEPFREVLLREKETAFKSPPSANVTHIFRVKAPLLEKGQTLCLLGSTASLGHWGTAAPVLLNRSRGQDFLTVALDLSGTSFPIAYKYGVWDLHRASFVRYEGASNRTLHQPGRVELTIVNDGFAVLPADTWKGAGVAIPVFSLRSGTSFGIGEFTDLKLLADWCAQTGLRMIQILPVNDTRATDTWSDSYPYAAISAFALHPVYLNLQLLAGKQYEAALKPFLAEQERLNALEAVDYEAVLKTKLAAIKELFPLLKEATFKSRRYQRFFAENQEWLVPYALFCQFRDQYGTSDFNQWPAHRTYDPAAAAMLALENSSAYDAVALHCFIQFHLDRQLADAVQYAHSKGIILKGDIPIGVYRLGADAWQNPELFHLGMQAGAPPDPFAAKGQNWGFPTYNWLAMKETGFAWWKRRLAQMGRHFDAFRIDHILGFFRIWSVPLDSIEGIMGRFVPALPVNPREFLDRGIKFDRGRFVEPWITDEVLLEIFGKENVSIKHRFLDTAEAGRHHLKPEFATQRQVERFFSALEPSAENVRLRQGLFDLISNVILFEVPGPNGPEYHFRFGVEGTSSFKDLDSVTQARLKDFCVDYFFRRQEEFWRQEALDKLPILKRSTRMLVCGEDLGMVPGCVPQVMKQLGILGLEIQRMPKDMSREFSRPQEATYLSVVTPSSHDMSTIRGWWKEDHNLTQKFYNQELSLPGEAPADCEPWLNRLIVEQHLASPAMWSIFQLQDLLGMDGQLRRNDPDAERINVPADPKNYWRYRMHLPLEALLQSNAFNDGLRHCVSKAGR